MSTRAGIIVENVLRVCNRQEHDATRTLVWDLLNQVYFDLCAIHPWHLLRDQVEIDCGSETDADRDLPANMSGIEAIQDATAGFFYYRRDWAGVDPDERGYRYFTERAYTEPLYFSQTGSVEFGADTFVDDDLSDDHTGEFVQFGKQPGMYLLTDAKEFSPAYYGPALTDCDIVIRPSCVERLTILDAWNVTLSNTVNVFYWKQPEPLYNESDLVVIPHPKVLELMVLREMPEAKARRPVSESEIEKAKEMALRMNPDFPTFTHARDMTNNVFDMHRLQASGGMWGRR